MNPASTNSSSRQFSRARNRSLIFNTIDKHGPVCRQDIVRLTNIRPATVLNYVEKLIKEGFVNVIGEGKSTGGRKPILLELNPKAAFAAGIHLSQSRIIGVIVNLKGKIVSQVTRKPSLAKGKTSFVASVLRTIEQIIRQS